MLFAFVCTDKPDSAELRQTIRAEHIKYMIAVIDRTVFGGPLLSEDGESSLGSIFAIDFPDRAAAEQFMADEPYTRAGLFENVQIHGWKQMVPEPEEGFLAAELARQTELRQRTG